MFHGWQTSLSLSPIVVESIHATPSTEQHVRKNSAAIDAEVPTLLQHLAHLANRRVKVDETQCPARDQRLHQSRADLAKNRDPAARSHDPIPAIQRPGVLRLEIQCDGLWSRCPHWTFSWPLREFATATGPHQRTQPGRPETANTSITARRTTRKKSPAVIVKPAQNRSPRCSGLFPGERGAFFDNTCPIWGQRQIPPRIFPQWRRTESRRSVERPSLRRSWSR